MPLRRWIELQDARGGYLEYTLREDTMSNPEETSTEPDPAEAEEIAADEPDPEDDTVLFEDALPGFDAPTDAPAEG